MKLSSKKSSCKINIISSSNEFHDIKNDWNKLVMKSTNPQPFLLWEWLYTWWDVYNTQGMKLYILAVYDADRLVAVAPFYIRNYTSLISRLSMLGDGERKRDKVVTHYPEIIVDVEYRSDVVSALAAFLQKDLFSGSGFSYASFELVKKNSVIQEVEQLLSETLIIKSSLMSNQFVIPLPDNEDEYMARLSKSTRKQFRLKLNRTQKDKVIKIESEPDLEKGLKLIEVLHRERWGSKSDQCIFDSSRFYTFHKRVCQQFAQQDILKFRVFYHNEEAVAAAYNLNYNNISYSYLSGFKSADDKRLSPMFIFDILEVKNLISKQYTHYDLLAADDANSYKTKYGCEVLPLYKLSWSQKGLTARGLAAYQFIRPFLAKMYHKTKGLKA